MKVTALLLLSLIGYAFGYPSYAGDCTYVLNPHSTAASGTGGYTFSGLPAAYVPGQTYTLTMTGTSNFKGFVAYAKNPNSAISANTDPRYGTWNPSSSTIQVTAGGCPG